MAISKAQNINSSSVSKKKKDPGEREAREKKTPWYTYTEWILLLNDFELFYAC